MFTIVPRPEILEQRDRRPASGEPIPTIIDHRHEKQANEKWFGGGSKNKQSYESLKNHRDALFMSELKYKKRIKELEKENEELVKVYEPTYEENNRLKSHIQNGPDAQKIKKLKEENRELVGELEIVKQENAEFTERVQELEKMFVSERDYYREKKWREAVERGRKKRNEKDAGIFVQGPFPDTRKPKKRNMKNVKDEEFENQDEFDLHIDNLEKETQILLNKIRQIKQNKENIDYVYFIGKGAVTRNAAIANAINEKLDRDLIAFEERLECLRKKAKTLNIDTNLKPTDLPGRAVEEKHKAEKKSKPLVTSNKYFRSKETQTTRLVEETIIEVRNNVTNDNLAHIATSVKNSIKAPNTTAKASGRKSSPAKRTEGDRKDSTGFTHSNSPANITPIEKHWGHLATKLNDTEKYGQSREIKSGLTHRDMNNRTKITEKGKQLNNSNILKLKGDSKTPFNTSSAKHQIKIPQEGKLKETSTPVSMTTATPDTGIISKRSQTNSGISQKNIVSGGTVSPWERESQTSSNHTNYKFRTDTAPKAETLHSADTSLNLSKTNTSESVRYIPTQGSDTGVRVKYTRDQTGRYSNGPEPIRKKETVKNTEKLHFEKQNKTVSTRVSAKNDALNVPYKDKYILPKQAMGDELENRINVSAYDEVLAEVKKQYKEQTLGSKNQMSESKVEPKRKQKKQSESAWQQGHNGHREDMLLEHIEFMSDVRTVNDEELRHLMGDSTQRQDNMYNRHSLNNSIMHGEKMYIGTH